MGLFAIQNRTIPQCHAGYRHHPSIYVSALTGPKESDTLLYSSESAVFRFRADCTYDRQPTLCQTLRLSVFNQSLSVLKIKHDVV